MEDRCKNCRWWDGADEEEGIEIRWCVRYPPIFKGNRAKGIKSISDWPKTAEYQRCGEFMKK